MTQDIKTTILGLGDLFETTGQLKENVKLIDVFRPWLVLAGVELHDLIHLSWAELTSPLHRIYSKLHAVASILDEDQAQEAACRELGSVSFYGEFIEGEDVAERMKINIHWDTINGSWMYISDATLRQRTGAARFVDARKDVREMLANAPNT
jgi:hypothetical protein